MAGLDLRLLQRRSGLHVPPRCTELAGRVFSLLYDSGETETLVINDTELTCSKAGGTLYLVSGRDSAYAIDIEQGAVTRVADGDNGPAISFGIFGDGKKRHELTRELDDNTVMWIFGTERALSVTACYSGGGVSLSRPAGLKELSVSEFAAVSLGGGFYLQCARVCGYDEPLTVALLSDFTRNLCVGTSLCEAPRHFSGYATHL